MSVLAFLKNLRDWIFDIDDLTPEEARRRMQGRPGFFASLPPETLEYIKNYDGPENHGPPLTRRERRDLERRRSAQIAEATNPPRAPGPDDPSG